MKQTIHITEILKNLELPLDSFDGILQCSDYHVACEKLNLFKLLVKKRKRVLAKKYHPDIPGGSVEKMQQINQMLDLAFSINIEPPRKRTVIRIFRQNYRPFSRSTTSSETYTSTNMWR